MLGLVVASVTTVIYVGFIIHLCYSYGGVKLWWSDEKSRSSALQAIGSFGIIVVIVWSFAVYLH